MTYNIIFVTCPDSKSTQKISNELLKKKLVACINKTKIKSEYLWKGKIKRRDEILMIIKTRYNLLGKIQKEVEKLHPYDVPEIISFKIDSGNKNYLNWISEVTR